jgi:alcohol dehydrogenase
MSSPRHRPRGWLRHYAGLLGPDGATGARLAFERNRGLRLRMLLASIGDGARQRARPTRPRMRALSAAPGGRLRWRDVPVPASPGPLGAIVHPIATATCDIDCPLVMGATPLPLPLHLGHECVAEVLTVGEQVSTVRPGDRVIVPFQINCGICPPCRAGLTGNCAAVPPLAAYGLGFTSGHWGGALSDQLAVPYADAMLVALPDHVDPVAAAGLADNICDAYRHVAPHLPRILEADPDAEVVILGALTPRFMFSYSVPLLVGLIARALGARNVYLADSRPVVRGHAERLGLNTLRPRELRRRAPAPLVVDASLTGLSLALSSTAPDGVCSSSGGLQHSTRVPFLLMYGRNVTLHVGRTHARALIPRALDLIAQGRLRPKDVITCVASVDDAPRVLSQHFREGGAKAVLTA